MKISLLACLASMLLAAAALAAAPVQQETACCTALDLHALTTLDALMPKLLDKNVVFVGETHDEYAHHLVQLEIVRRLHQAHPDLVIAMEQFRQPSQLDLDDYVAGRIDEKSLLQRTRYFQTSNFDYRLFRPVLKYTSISQ